MFGLDRPGAILCAWGLSLLKFECLANFCEILVGKIVSAEDQRY